jgi:hypothetical protein
LTAASTAVKRAIQFGSRISHVVDTQRFGSRRKANRRHKQKGDSSKNNSNNSKNNNLSNNNLQKYITKQ